MPAQHKKASIWLAVIAGLTLAILAPALWNRFPFVFYDSGAYIELAVNGGFMPERSAFYAMFLGAVRAQFSLWPAAVAQVLLTLLVMADFARIVLPRLSPGRFFALGLVLAVGTSLPWYAADIMPDVFTPILVMCLYLLGFRADALSRWHMAALVAVAVLATTAHSSHLALTAGLAAAVAFARIVAWRTASQCASPRWSMPTLVFGLSLAALLTSNFVRTGDVFISRSGPAFVLARLVQDGVVKQLLDDTCPQSGYRLCAYKDDLPVTAEHYLWKWWSPFPKLGGFEGTAVESQRMIVDSLERYPWLHLKLAVKHTIQQAAIFKTGDGVEPLYDVPLPALQRSIPQQLDAYHAARQQTEGYDFQWLNKIHVPLEGLSVVALAALAFRAARRRTWDDRLFLPSFLLVALLGNAAICGVLSSPHDRYQSRIMWLMVFAVPLLLAYRPATRGRP